MFASVLESFIQFTKWKGSWLGKRFWSLERNHTFQFYLEERVLYEDYGQSIKNLFVMVVITLQAFNGFVVGLNINYVPKSSGKSDKQSDK